MTLEFKSREGQTQRAFPRSLHLTLPAFPAQLKPKTPANDENAPPLPLAMGDLEAVGSQPRTKVSKKQPAVDKEPAPSEDEAHAQPKQKRGKSAPMPVLPLGVRNGAPAPHAAAAPPQQQRKSTGSLKAPAPVEAVTAQTKQAPKQQLQSEPVVTAQQEPAADLTKRRGRPPKTQVVEVTAVAAPSAAVVPKEGLEVKKAARKSASDPVIEGPDPKKPRKSASAPATAAGDALNP